MTKQVWKLGSKMKTIPLNEEPTLLIGSKLPNGAIILALRQDDDGDGVVLADWQHNNPQRYVTWRCSPRGITFFGHYFHSIAEAAKDFETR